MYNTLELDAMLNEYKSCIASVKVFLTASSSNEYVSDKTKLREIFKIALKYDKPVIVHTELGKMISDNQTKYSSDDYNSAIYHNAIRHKDSAIQGTKLVLEVSREVGNKIYIAHTSVKGELDLIHEYKSKYGVNAFCEVTPHHLMLNDKILEKVGNYGKVNPPIREQYEVDAMWDGIDKGIVDTVGSDHAPHEKSNKDKPYFSAPSGFPGLETSIPLLVNEMVKGRLTYDQLVDLTSRNTAKIFNVKNRGDLKVGMFADISIIDHELEYTISPSDFHTKAKYSPYNGMKVNGKVLMTIVNGKTVYDDGKINKTHLGKEIEHG